MKRIAGLDPSLTGTGLALPDGQTLTLTPPAGMRGVQRLAWIRGEVLHHLYLQVDLVVIEGLAYAAKGASVLDLAGLAHVLRLALHDHDIPYADAPPAALKGYVTGKGGGKGTDKRNVALDLQQRTGLRFDDDNQTDAWALRAMGLDRVGFPLVRMPQTHRRWLEKVAWPEAVMPT